MSSNISNSNSSDDKTIYWSLLTNEGWKLYIAAMEDGLCFVGSQNQPFEELADWAEAKYPGLPLIKDEEKLHPYQEELVQYLRGELERFSIPNSYRGTPFQASVWQALCDIPYGETRTYSEIAEYIGRPAAVRAVGAAIGANPVMITIPCHRVIGKNGSLTGFRGGLDMKRKLLELEGRLT